MTQTHPFHMVPRPNPPFTRDRLTWLSYGMLIYFSYFQTILGPALPFLQADLHLSYGMAAWHFSAFGCGMIFAGLTADVLSRQPGRAAIFWGGGGGMTLGGMLIVLGHQEWMTLTGALAMGSFGTLLLVGIQAALADRHEERQGIALAEANIGASLGAGLSAFCVAGFALMGVNWRGTLVVPVIALCALSVVGRREALGHTSQSTGGGETLSALQPSSKPLSTPYHPGSAHLPGLVRHTHAAHRTLGSHLQCVSDTGIDDQPVGYGWSHYRPDSDAASLTGHGALSRRGAKAAASFLTPDYWTLPERQA